MKRLIVLLLAAVPFAAPIAASAQTGGRSPYYDPRQAQAYDRAMPSYQDDEGYTQGWDARSTDARRGALPPTTTYAPPEATQGVDGYYGGYGYGDEDGPDGNGPDGNGGYYNDAPPPPPPGTRPRAGRPAARSPYADRIARWRARADACEAGDARACGGPE